jgi:TfoX/Sxy family transcriptional regulator of competence genes
MPSSPSYRDFILDQLSDIPGISTRRMMGEYILYCDGKIVGGIYDDRLLVKPTPAARAQMPAAPLELPYDGAKPMLLVEDVDNKSFLSSLVAAIRDDLPAPKR